VTVYKQRKQRRAELNDLKAENGILSQTLEILMAQEGALSDSIDRITTLETATNCKRFNSATNQYNL
jgi:hypothetical protein